LGIGNGTIKESQLSVSSLYKEFYYRGGLGPYRAGVDKEAYWAPAFGLASHDRGQYIQVDFVTLKDIKIVSW